MFKHVVAALAVLGVAISSASAATVSINFDDLTGGQDVNGAYASQGVSFVDAQVRELTLTGSSGPNMIQHSSLGSEPTEADPIEILFDTPVTQVSLRALDVGIGGIRLKAFDSISGGVIVDLIEFTPVNGVASGLDNVFDFLLQANNIRRVEISLLTLGTGDGFLIDDLAFEQAVVTPLPAGAVLFLTGIAAFSGARRKKKSAK